MIQEINKYRPLQTIFEMDEDVEIEFERFYPIAKRTLLNCGSISRKELCTLFRINQDLADRIMTKIKLDFFKKINKE